MVHSEYLWHSLARKRNDPFCNQKDPKRPPFPDWRTFLNLAFKILYGRRERKKKPPPP